MASNSATTSTRLLHPVSVLALTLIIGWALVILVVDRLRFVVFDPDAKTGVEVILGLANLFVALVLGLFPPTRDRRRLQWVVSGFLCLGSGSLIFGYVTPLLTGVPDINRSMYSSLAVRIGAALLLLVGLLPSRAPQLSPRRLLVILLGVLAVALLAYASVGYLPTLAHQTDFAVAAREDSTTLGGLTAWHWGLSIIPIVLVMLATIGATRNYPGRVLHGWLVLALAVLIGANWHTLFWPSDYTPVVTTATLMRLAFTGIVIAGGVLELHQISNERAATLATAREYAERVTELATFKADFTAIVAHELTTPLSAIRRYTDLIPLVKQSEQHQQVVDAIHNELDILSNLVADVHMIADVERVDFDVELHTVSTQAIMEDAARYARTLPGNHPVRSTLCDAQVRADPERIAQVLRNLLNNAAKYSPPESPIDICARQDGHLVWFEVIDHGYGIPAGELGRIFDKFERGADPRIRQAAGAGLGLYLSRKILEAHGAEITVASAPGRGSTFRFTLEVVP